MAAEKDTDTYGITAPYGDELNDDVARWDRAGEFPHEKWKPLQRSGLFTLPFAPEHGGAGRTLTETMAALEGLGHTSRDAGLNFSASTQIVSVGIPLQAFGSEELRSRYLPRVTSGEAITAHAITEPSHGSDVMNIRTTAVREGDTYVIDGGKMFITNAPVADLFLLYVRTGKPGAFGLSTFLAERSTPGLKIGEPLETMGLRTSPISEVTLDNVRLPAANRLGSEGAGFLIMDYVMKREVLFSFAVNLGEMTHRLKRVVEHATTRQQFGSSIGKNQAVSHKIADMRIAVETARKWLYDTGRKVEQGTDASLDVAATKIVVSEANQLTAQHAIQIFGARGYLTDTGIERELRNATSGSIYSGTNEIQRNCIAALMGL
ncbi:acyl-CoA dehydrogenase family protein [Streptomyces sp. NPDC007027]|uniref:acyl-CoA dehydrogenase family protein n=1 Tax=unclassified Streptomyces TaxID=2593676 RepID=UPI0033C4A591